MNNNDHDNTAIVHHASVADVRVNREEQLDCLTLLRSTAPLTKSPSPSSSSSSSCSSAPLELVVTSVSMGDSSVSTTASLDEKNQRRGDVVNIDGDDDEREESEGEEEEEEDDGSKMRRHAAVDRVPVVGTLTAKDRKQLMTLAAKLLFSSSSSSSSSSSAAVPSSAWDGTTNSGVSYRAASSAPSSGAALFLLFSPPVPPPTSPPTPSSSENMMTSHRSSASRSSTANGSRAGTEIMSDSVVSQQQQQQMALVPCLSKSSPSFGASFSTTTTSSSTPSSTEEAAPSSKAESQDENDKLTSMTQLSVQPSLQRHDLPLPTSLQMGLSSEWWSRIPLSLLQQVYGVSDSSRGLCSCMVEERRIRFGLNTLKPAAAPSWLRLFLFQFTNPLVLLLFMAAVISLSLREFIEGGAMLVTVMLNAIIAVHTEFTASNALAALLALSRPFTTVIRHAHSFHLRQLQQQHQDGVGDDGSRDVVTVNVGDSVDACADTDATTHPSLSGQNEVVGTEELVPGDIVVLRSGDVVPADARLVSAVDVTVNEMLLTGESTDVHKFAMDTVEVEHESSGGGGGLTPSNLVFCGSTVTGGHAVAIVVTTGIHTRLGSIAQLLAQATRSNANSSPPQTSSFNNNHSSSSSLSDTWSYLKRAWVNCRNKLFPKLRKKTPLQKQLQTLGLQISGIAISLCVLTFGIGITGNYRHDPSTDADEPVWLPMLLLVVTMAVSAIPEGLPLAVTVCLTLGSHRLVKHCNALVTRLTAVEALGMTTVVCTDKTGTLTSGVMTVVRAWSSHFDYVITGKAYQQQGRVRRIGSSLSSPSQFIQFSSTTATTAGACNLDGQMKKKNDRVDLPLLASFLCAILCNNSTVSLNQNDTVDNKNLTTDNHSSHDASDHDEDDDEDDDDDEAGNSDDATLLPSSSSSSSSSREEGMKKVFTVNGSTTEAALVIAAAKCGLSQSRLSAWLPRLDEIPFSSERKLMLTLHRYHPPSALSSSPASSAALSSSPPPQKRSALEENIFALLQAGSKSTSHHATTSASASATSSTSVKSSESAPSFIAFIKGAPNYILDMCSHMIVAPNHPHVRFNDDLDTHHNDDDEDNEEECGKEGVRIVRLTARRRAAIERVIESYSADALRLIGTAHKYIQTAADLPPHLHASTTSSTTASPPISADAKLSFFRSQPSSSSSSASSFIFSGLLASMDPERKGVGTAIATAEQAGVRTIMITGDYLTTAKAIAKKIGLIKADSDAESCSVDASVLRVRRRVGSSEGDTSSFSYIRDRDIDAIVSRSLVFARALPQDKFQIVKSLQRMGHVVAMTGDGVNDGPALGAADIGVAMGSGTSVAKGASQMILVDDNFVTIIRAIRNGRVVFCNIQKFITMFLAVNMTQLALIIISVACGLPTPLMPLQILFLNLGIDGLPMLALSTESGATESEAIMKQPPRQARTPILQAAHRISVAVHCLVLISTALILFTVLLWWECGAVQLADLSSQSSCNGSDKVATPSDALKHARTGVFLLLALCENGRAFTIRSTTRPFYHRFNSNRTLLLAVTVSVSLTLLIVLTPPIASIFSVDGTTLQWHVYLIIIALAALTVIIDEIAKAMMNAHTETQRRWENLFAQTQHLRDELAAIRSLYTPNSDSKLQRSNGRVLAHVP